jgi:hypothetical protein
MQQLDYKNKIAGFSMWSVPRYLKQWTRSVDSSVRESVKRELEPEADEYPLLEQLLGNV